MNVGRGDPLNVLLKLEAGVVARELTRLAVPMAATQLAQMIILATDTVMLGHFSKEALAAGAM